MNSVKNMSSLSEISQGPKNETSEAKDGVEPSPNA